MADTQPLDVGQLYQHLRDTLRHGARASRLLRHTPEVIELLYPAAVYPHLSIHDRALKTETLIRDATHTIGGNPGEAIATILCLPPGTTGRTLEHRRRIAAHYLDVEADTFRRDWHEGALLYDLTIEIYRHHHTENTATRNPKAELHDAAIALPPVVAALIIGLLVGKNWSMVSRRLVR
jgi:hypothetical protein